MKKRLIVAMILVSCMLTTSCSASEEEEAISSNSVVETSSETVLSNEVENLQDQKEEKIEVVYSEPEKKIHEVETQVQPLPTSILNEVLQQKKKYPGMAIGVGIYSLDGKMGYEYNPEQAISGGCTVKAPYALYVLQQCEEQGIDIDIDMIMYQSGMRNGGSGIIKNSKYGTSYTIAYLLEKLLDISDNTAYNILVSRFPLSQYQEFLNTIDGQQLNGRQYGSASVLQRKNEWLTIYEYLNSDAKYATTLKNDVTNTKYCYITDWMKGEHNYMHKSGWCYGKSYTSAADCAIIDENYLLIILTQDYATGTAHTDTVRSIGVRVEEYADSLGGHIF